MFAITSTHGALPELAISDLKSLLAIDADNEVGLMVPIVDGNKASRVLVISSRPILIDRAEVETVLVDDDEDPETPEVEEETIQAINTSASEANDTAMMIPAGVPMLFSTVGARAIGFFNPDSGYGDLNADDASAYVSVCWYK